MTDYKQEQEMEIEALQAILMDDIQEIDPSDCGLKTTFPCFQIKVSPSDDDGDETTSVPVRLAVNFSHSEKYPDEPPLLEVKSLQGLKIQDLADLKNKLDQEAVENLGMAMIYTLVTSAKEWLREHYSESFDFEGDNSDEDLKDEVIEPHGEAVTVDTFLAWRERFEAEQALERARLIPDAALIASKEKRPSGRAWFESGAGKGVKQVIEWNEEQDDEEMEFEDDFDDGDIDDDMLEYYLSSKA